MTWFILGLSNLACLTILRLSQKLFVTKYPLVNAFRINWITSLVSLPIIGYVLVNNSHRIAHLSGAFWLTTIAVVVGFYPAVMYLLFEVIRLHELSNVLPFLGLTPIVTALLGWLILGQVPSLVALIGIFAICASIYVLQLKPSMSFLKPFALMRASFAARSMMIISIITACAAIGDKYAIEKSTTSIYFAINTLGAVVILLLCDLIFRKKHEVAIVPYFKTMKKHQALYLAWLGIAVLLVQLSGFASVRYAHNTSYVVAIRTLYIVTSSILGIIVYKETSNRYKMACYGLSAIGVVMIAL